MHLADLETPCLVLDAAKMNSNIDRMRAHLRHSDIPLRPHLKTGKCAEIARLLTEHQPGGIAVSTLAEADYFFRRGFLDILYVVGIAPAKLKQVTRLMLDGAKLTIVLDCLDAVLAASSMGREMGLQIPVLIEVDCDGHRSGVKPNDPNLIPLARTIHESSGTALGGVMCHAGGSYDCTSIACIQTAAENERVVTTSIAACLVGAGLPCPIISTGSTPTALLGTRFDGITEVRAGVFVFQDLMMVNLGVCEPADIAISVLTSVIGQRAEKNWLITDSGWTALSSDQGTRGQSVDYKFGQVCDGTTGEIIEDLIVIGLNQEHGIVARRDGGPLSLKKFPVGTLLRVLPVHACAMAEAHKAYHVVSGDDRILAVWERIRGWSGI